MTGAEDEAAIEAAAQLPAAGYDRVLGMAAPTDVAARRYLDASTFGADVDDRESQVAAWSALDKLTREINVSTVA